MADTQSGVTWSSRFKKGHSGEVGGYKCAKSFETTTQSIRSAVSAARAKTTTNLIHCKTLSLLCHPDKGGREDHFKIILQAKNFMQEEETRSIYDKN